MSKDDRIEPILGDYLAALEQDTAIDPSMEGVDDVDLDEYEWHFDGNEDGK